MVSQQIGELKKDIPICSIGHNDCQVNDKSTFLELAALLPEGQKIEVSTSSGYIHHIIELDGIRISYLS